MKTPLFLALSLMALGAWALVVEDDSRPIRPGNPAGGIPFWNYSATVFRHAPVFEFKEVPGAVHYVCTVTSEAGETFTLKKITRCMSLASVWPQMKAGNWSATCRAYSEKGDRDFGVAGVRKFSKLAPFVAGKYPAAKHSYREAALKVYDYMTSLDAMRKLAETGKQDQTYQHNAYVTKTHAAHVNAMLRWAKADPVKKEKAMVFAKASAEYLLPQLEPAAAPLAHWPPTYGRKPLEFDPATTPKRKAMIGNEPEGAVKYRREVMTVYPATAGDAFLAYYKATDDKRFLDAALGIAETYLKIRCADGSWPLKCILATGEPVGTNVLVPTRLVSFFENLGRVTKDEKWLKESETCFKAMAESSLKTWNWDGQFEDIEPKPPYMGLTKHNAIEAMFYILKHPKAVQNPLALCRDILDWSEDQFVFWEEPVGGKIWAPGREPEKTYLTSVAGWTYPSAFEQYSCYVAIDASSDKLILAYLAMYKATKEEIYLEKAKALGDALVNVQEADGRIPTFMVGKGWLADRQYDWLNCMAATADALLALDETLRGPVVTEVRHEEGPKSYSFRCSRDHVRMEPCVEKTPDGSAAVSFTVLGDPVEVAHSKDVVFDVEGVELKKGCYRFAYYARADRPVKASGAVRQCQKPWKTYGGGSSEVSTAWRLKDGVFMIDEDLPAQRLSAPVIIVGHLEKGTRLDFGPFKLERLEPERMKAGKAWRPLDMGENLPRPIYFQTAKLPGLDIVPGTALDLSQFIDRQDIAKGGRLVAKPDGDLYQENDPEKKTVRLRGFNWTGPNPWDDFRQFTDADIDAFAEQVRLHGMNILRFHFWDKLFVGQGGMDWFKNRDLDVADAEMPETYEALMKTVDRTFLERFQYLMKALKDRGIFIWFDIFTSNTMMVKAGKAKDYPRYQLFVIERYRNHFKAAYDVWMKTPNPYTGTRLLDDPMVAGITFFNEQEHLFGGKFGRKGEMVRFTDAFRAAYGADMPEFGVDLLRRADKVGDNARAFLRRQIKAMNEFCLGVVRESGFRGLCTNWDMFMRNLEGDSRKDFNAVSIHPYHAHPGLGADHCPEGFLADNYMNPWSFGPSVSLGSSLMWNNYMAAASMTRVLGKPFLVTEMSHCGGNRFVQEAPVVQTAAFALQGWQGYLPHANTIAHTFYAPNGPSFEDAINPSARVTQLVAGFGWQRGDVKAARHAVTLAVPEKDLAGRFYTGALGSPYNCQYMLTKVGSDYTQRPNPVSDYEVTPKCYALAEDMGMWAKVQEEVEVEKDERLAQIAFLREKGVLLAGNATDAARGHFVSETGEIVTDLQESFISIDAPRLQAVALKPGKGAELSALRVKDVSVPASIVAISLERNRAVSASSHLLLVVNTRFRGNGSVWYRENAWNEAQIEEGDYRNLIEAGRFRFAILTDLTEPPKVYALKMSGERRCEVPVVFRQGHLVFDLDTSAFQWGTPYFEITEE